MPSNALQIYETQRVTLFTRDTFEYQKLDLSKLHNRFSMTFYKILELLVYIYNPNRLRKKTLANLLNLILE